MGGPLWVSRNDVVPRTMRCTIAGTSPALGQTGEVLGSATLEITFVGRQHLRQISSHRSIRLRTVSMVRPSAISLATRLVMPFTARTDPMRAIHGPIQRPRAEGSCERSAQALAPLATGRQFVNGRSVIRQGGVADYSGPLGCCRCCRSLSKRVGPTVAPRRPRRESGHVRRR